MPAEPAPAENAPSDMTSDLPPDLPFDLTPSDEQRLLVEAFDRFAAEQIRPGAQKADMERSMPDGLLDQIAALGLHLMAMPADCGGIGGRRDPVLSALAAESLAHGDMAVALAAFAPVSFVHAVVDGGTEEQCRNWLPQLAGEKFVAATVAAAEPEADADPLKPALSASRKSVGADWVLQGGKSAVPLGCDAQWLLVTASVQAKDGTAPAAFVVPGSARGLKREPQRWMGLGSLDLAELVFDGVSVPAENCLGEEGQAFDLERLVSLGRTGLAAMATGVCQAVVDYSVPYCNEREAFGEPISHRQAVAFKLADAVTETEGMRLMMLRAASLAALGQPFAREAWLARLQAAEHGMQIGSDGVQLLGGHGFTREHPVELWYRNLRSVALLEGVCIL